ncbi:DUF2071 domain-containing protein [Kiritimatiellota bacterium B12222]|nr:DUF2071 domain-containing protein [Kiritimatiellota bacterium B12222]
MIRRRFLLNFRIKEEVIRQIIPKGFEPKLYQGWGMAGICLIRLEKIHPACIPMSFGLKSENAAHRFAVKVQGKDGEREAVYVPRRDTNSRWNHMAGGRLFPGIQHLATFTVDETEDGYDFAMKSVDGKVSVRFSGRESEALPVASLFESLQEASRFFEAGSLGYSDSKQDKQYDGMVLHTEQWKVSPFAVDQVYSSYFEDDHLFPPGSVEFDHALFMKNIPHEWHPVSEMKVEDEK